jgi:hypothetical protein
MAFLERFVLASLQTRVIEVTLTLPMTMCGGRKSRSSLPSSWSSPQNLVLDTVERLGNRCLSSQREKNLEARKASKAPAAVVI